MTFTFQDHVTIGFAICNFILVALGILSLSPAVFKTLNSRYIGVTTLTFHGHMTSLVMWPFDSPFLLVVVWNRASMSNGFRDILHQTSCTLTHMLNRHLRMINITWCVSRT